MIALLREQPGLTVPELSKAMRRSERTIYRWLSEVTSALRMRVYCKDGGYYLTEQDLVRRVELTPQELLALCISLRSSPFADNPTVSKAAASAWVKIRDAVPWRDLQMAEGLTDSRSIKVTAPTGDIRPGVVELIEHSIDAHRRLHMVYRSQRSDRVKEYVVDPYAIAFRRHAWYLVGLSREHGKPVQFKLVRVLSARETGESFIPPTDFSVDEFFGLSWEGWAGGEPVRVKVRFSPRVARMVSEVRRHPTQIVHPQEDGGIVFEATVAGVEEIAIWIMGYGKEAEVLEPQTLRDLVLDHARGVAELYSQSP